jgi:hypothetical protein
MHVPSTRYPLILCYASVTEQVTKYLGVRDVLSLCSASRLHLPCRVWLTRVELDRGSLQPRSVHPWLARFTALTTLHIRDASWGGLGMHLFKVRVVGRLTLT